MSTAYGQALTKFTDEEQKMLVKLGIDRTARTFYETLWREFNYAYQMILYEYMTQRKFNPNLAPEYQVRQLFPEKKLSDYRLPVEFAIITRQIADEMANLPRAKWMSLTKDEGQRAGKSKVFQHLYDYVYDSCDGDVETFKTLLAKSIYGTSYEYIFHEYLTYPDFEATEVKDGEVQFKEIKRVISQTKFKNIDVRRVFMDANCTDIRDAEHCFIGQNFGEDTFKLTFPDGELWDTKNVSACAASDVYVSLGETRKNQAMRVVQLMHYYHVPSNTYAVLANGKKINKKELHIPVPSYQGRPMIPLAVFYDSRADGEFYGISKSAIIKPFREVKNKLRNAFFDTAKKAAFNTLIIDPMSDFDETNYEFGQPFIRAVPDEVKPIPTSANLQPVIELDKQTDQDLIWATGINFLDVAQGQSSESATKTAVRKESQVKLVELGLKYNAADGFKRRAILMKNLIRLHYSSARVKKIVGESSEPLEITTKGVNLKRGFFDKNKIYEQKTQGNSRFVIRAEDLQDDVDLILEGGSIAATKELVKARQKEAVEFIMSIPSDPQGQLPFVPEELVAWAIKWGELPPEIARGGEKSIEDKNPEEIMEEMDLIEKPPNVQDFLKEKNANQALSQQAAQASAEKGAIPGQV